MWILLLALVCIGLCAIIAQHKNRNIGYAAIWGFLFSWIAVLVYLCLEPLATCPHCGIKIKTNATICYKCGKKI